MKVLRRREFLQMPEGTIYAKGKGFSFQGLNFKGRSLENDWYALDPCWVEASDSEEAFNRLEQMLESGASYPMQESIGRDGMYDQDDLFLVYERADVLVLSFLIANALAVSE